MTFSEEIQKEVVAYAKYMSNVMAIQRAVELTGLGELSGYMTLDAILCSGESPAIKLFVDNDEATLDTVARTLAKYGKTVEKGFDAEGNRLVLTTMIDGVKVEARFSTPETCTVERVSEEVVVPEHFVPEHTETRMRYRLVGDCGPLLKSEAVGA
jgi:hypothetical protein